MGIRVAMPSLNRNGRMETTMDTEQRRQLRIVSRGGKLPENSQARDRNGTALSEDREKWVTRMWGEVERVQSLMDQLSTGMLDMLLHQSTDPTRNLPREIELHILQAYYKGLRFAIDCRKDFANEE